MAAGKKTGGRQVGSRNKATKAREEVISASGLTPLEYMLSVLRDPESDKSQKMDAAKASAPYVHPRLAAIEHSGDPDRPLVHQSLPADPVEAAKVYQRIMSGEG